MIFSVEKGLIFTKHCCFRELVRRYPWNFLIMLSQTMNTDVLDFGGLAGFWDSVDGLSFSLSVPQFSLFITWLISFIFEDVTSVLVKCVFSSGCTWITLSICISFTLLFCFANFVNWHSLTDWIGFEVMGIQVLRRSFFQESCQVSDFHMDCYFAFTGVSSEQCSNDIVFFLYFLP